MITIAACGRARIAVDVWFTDGNLRTLDIGLDRPDGFLVFLNESNIQAVRAQVDNCVEEGGGIPWDPGVVVYEPDRSIGAMLCVADGEVEAFTSDHGTWEWKR